MKLRRPTETLAVRALIPALVLVACSTGDENRQPIPLPAGIEQMDPGVERQFRDAHARLARLQADADAPDVQLSEAFGHLGMVFHAYFNVERASDYYRHAIDLEPEEVRWHHYLALAQRMAGDWSAAEEAAREVLKLRPEYPAARVLLAELILDQDRVEEAEAMFRDLTAADPSLAPAWIGRARCALVLGRHAETIELAREALAWSPRTSQTHYLLGQAYSALGDHEAAARHFDVLPQANLLMQTTTVQDPLWREVVNLKLGALDHTRESARAFVQKSYEVSLIELDQALAANPDLIHARYSKAYVLREIGRSEDAVNELDLLLAEHPQHEPSLRMMGSILVEAGEFEQAKRYLDAALAANPASEAAFLARGDLHRRTGRPRLAMSDFRSALEFDPGLADAHFWLATTLLLDGEAEQAWTTVERAVAALGGNANLRMLRVRILLARVADGTERRERLSEGVTLARELVAQSPTIAHAETLAMALAENDGFAAARAWQRAVVSAAGGSAPWAARRLRDYDRQQPCESPWEREERPLDHLVEPPTDG
jgi:tetratricopeptide (TPR) repeat protein